MGIAKRNVAILGFTDSGKTTIADLLSFLSPDDKREYRGSVEGRDTLTDTGRVEKRRGITIHTVPFMRGYSCGGKNFQVNFIDTPGHPEFAYQVSVGMQAAEGAIFLIDAQQGFRYHAASLLQQIRAAKLPVIVAINKLDSLSPGDFNKSVEGICLSALGYGFRFNALQEYTPFGSLDDRVFGEINMDDSKDPLPTLETSNLDLTRDGSIPALFTSGKMAIGVKELLAYAIHHFPGPEHNRLYQKIPDQREGSFSAQLMNCFPKGNQWMTPVRVFSGTLERGERVRNQTTGKHHRLGELYASDGITLLSSVSTGDIFLLRNPPDGATAGDTLLRSSQPSKEFSYVKLLPPKRSAIGVNLSSPDIFGLCSAAREMARWDPSVTVEPTPQGVACYGAGGFHLEIFQDLLREELGLRGLSGTPSFRLFAAPQKVGFFDGRSFFRDEGYTLRVKLKNDKEYMADTIRFEPRVSAAKSSLSGIAESLYSQLASHRWFGYPVAGLSVEVLEGSSPTGSASTRTINGAIADVVDKLLYHGTMALMEPYVQIIFGAGNNASLKELSSAFRRAGANTGFVEHLSHTSYNPGDGISSELVEVYLSFIRRDRNRQPGDQMFPLSHLIDPPQITLPASSYLSVADMPLRVFLGNESYFRKVLKDTPYIFLQLDYFPVPKNAAREIILAEAGRAACEK